MLIRLERFFMGAVDGTFRFAAATCFPRGGSRASSFLRGLDLSSFPAGVRLPSLHFTLGGKEDYDFSSTEDLI
jgi:hypothetical protein